jgi:Zn ribbon nucleic-acid-binding protein
MLLEYKFSGVPERGLHTNDYFKYKKGQEFTFLLCLFTKIVYGQVNFGSQVWITDISEARPQTSKYVHEGYLYNLKTDNLFTDVTPLKELSKIPDSKYFFEGDAFNDVFALPEIFDTLCERYFGLNQNQQETFQRTCYWFQISTRIFNVSLSVSFSNLVTAIEVLANETDIELVECPSCGHIEYKPTKQFKDFIQKYSKGLSRKQIDNFYAKRSDLSHGKLVFSSDLYGVSTLHTSFEDHNEWRSLHNVTRTVILNWLLTNRRK